MVCDFFYPRTGGVEMHIWSLAQCLLRYGHKVVVVTHAYDDRRGIRYMTNGLKVYYCPLVPFVDKDVWPTLYAFFPIFRSILLRESVSIVHTHQATSVMSIECALYAKTMGYKVVYTDHSLFSFSDAASIHINLVMRFILSNVNHAICVSYTCRENLALRARLHPRMISVIPNAIDPHKFTPNPQTGPVKGRITIVVISRLVYRKGIDLVVRIIPTLCARHPELRFLIAGDGSKRPLLDEMRDKYQLHKQVSLLGGVSNTQVRDILVQGQIFLNCSLTESFCIAILEAACCGLFVVSTRVGGVPEILPPSMLYLAEPNMESLIEGVEAAIPLALKVDPAQQHRQVRQMYSWHDVARRTIKVYNHVAAQPDCSFAIRLVKYSTVGGAGGWVACFVMTVMYLFLQLLEWLLPASSIQKAAELFKDTRAKTQKNTS